jgi:hypothetical protein
MLESLQIYLECSPRCNTECTPDLVQTVARLRRRLVDFVLSDESSTHSLFERIFDPISSAVEEVDANPTRPEATTQRLSHNQIPDMLYRPCRGRSPQLHVELKNWTCFSHHAAQIVQLGQRQEILQLENREVEERSIIFKVCSS